MITIAGLNHDSGGLELLAQACLPGNKLVEGLCSLRQSIPKTAEALVLTTCNRCELYVSGVPVEHAVHWLSRYRGIPTEVFEKHAYLHKGEAALIHLIKVACGLNSMLIGETQILGQVKSALRSARETGCTGTQLSRLFEHALAAARRVRHETEIGKQSISFPALVVRLSRHIFADLHQKHALLIGGGEMVQTTMKYFLERGIKSCHVAGRSLEKTAPLAARFGAEVLDMADLPDKLHNFDIVVSSTTSEKCILELDTVKTAMNKRRHRVMFMADLAMLHDIDVRVGKLDDVFLYDLEHLANTVGQNQKLRVQAGQQAQAIIAQEVAKYFAWNRAQKLGELIASYKARTNEERDELKKSAMAMLHKGKSPEKVVDYLCTTLGSTLSHQTITLLKKLISLDTPSSPVTEKKTASQQPPK